MNAGKGLRFGAFAVSQCLAHILNRRELRGHKRKSIPADHRPRLRDEPCADTHLRADPHARHQCGLRANGAAFAEGHMAAEPSILAKNRPRSDMAKRANPRASANLSPWFHTGLRMNARRTRPPPMIKSLRETHHGKTGPRNKDCAQKVETVPVGTLGQ